jgi:hypothetical protein
MPLGAFKSALMGTAGVSTADVVLLSSQTASSSASIDFTSGITSTYGEYIFKFYNIHPATDNADFTFQANATDSTSYDETMTTTFVRADHNEADDQAYLQYYVHADQAQGTAYQTLALDPGNDNDQSVSGELHLFNPASTTYVKHFIARISTYQGSDFIRDAHVAGYINTTTAIDDVQFKMASGNIDAGTIKMWGVK